jgi:hypothetical protein
MPFTDEEIAHFSAVHKAFFRDYAGLGSFEQAQRKRLDLIPIWKEGEPLPEPTHIQSNHDHDATRNDYTRMVKENNRLVQEIQKLRAAVQELSVDHKHDRSNAMPYTKEEFLAACGKARIGDAVPIPAGVDVREIITGEDVDEVMPGVREFSTGATRSSDAGRYDPEGFLSPIVVERFCEYMHRNRVMADGSTRASDNWQAGIPIDQYMKGAFRHFLHLWTRHRGFQVMDENAAKDIEDDLCALLFNVQGMLFELLQEKRK